MGTSSPSGETRYNWNEDMAPRWNSVLNTAPWAAGFEMNADGNVVGIKPRSTYTGERFAPVNYDQSVVGGYLRNMNTGSSSPLNAMNGARSQIEGTLNGDYSGEAANPYMGLRPAGGNPFIGGNQFMDQNTSTDRNMYAGDNPYFRQVLNQGMEDITSNYQKGTAADTTRMFNQSGAFGGGAHQNAIANNEAALGKTLNNFAGSMLNEQYNRSAGLEDQYLSRDMQNQQFNRSTGAGLREAELGRGFQNYNMGLDRGMAGLDAERNRQMQAIGYGQNEQNLAYDRAAQQFGYGSFLQNQDQQNRDFQFDQWTQTQNYPFTMIDWLSNLYGRAQGGGNMNQSVYSGAGSQAAPWLGAALAGASFFK